LDLEAVFFLHCFNPRVIEITMRRRTSHRPTITKNRFRMASWGNGFRTALGSQASQDCFAPFFHSQPSPAVQAASPRRRFLLFLICVECVSQKYRYAAENQKRNDNCPDATPAAIG
jgi:hypothetical protein